jgi:hypothetical protein
LNFQALVNLEAGVNFAMLFALRAYSANLDFIKYPTFVKITIFFTRMLQTLWHFFSNPMGVIRLQKQCA